MTRIPDLGAIQGGLHPDASARAYRSGMNLTSMLNFLNDELAFGSSVNNAADSPQAPMDIDPDSPRAAAGRVERHLTEVSQQPVLLNMEPTVPFAAAPIERLG